MRVVASADFHGSVLPDIPECDLLLYAGDIGGERFAFGPFKEWLEAVPARHIVGIAGNHDGWAAPTALHTSAGGNETLPSPARKLPWTYLYNESVEIDGVNIWGSPYSCEFGGWSFMAPDAALARVWEMIPDETDIILVHGPPYHACDTVNFAMNRDPHVGSKTLANRILELPRVQYVVCGHIHEAYGSSRIRRLDNSAAWVYNVSVMGSGFRPQNAPVEFEMMVWDHAAA